MLLYSLLRRAFSYGPLGLPAGCVRLIEERAAVSQGMTECPNLCGKRADLDGSFRLDWVVDLGGLYSTMQPLVLQPSSVIVTLICTVI